jgi:predicted dithiol-disulfide oxidoreductase (DUF899 family)
MVEVEKEYVFEGPDGPATLLDLFEGRRQLIVQHFMFDPEWDDSYPSCTYFSDDLVHLPHLHEKDTSFALVSRAPLEKIKAYKRRRGWTFPWYSSFGSDFNYDFHVTMDESVAPAEYNYRTKPEHERRGMPWYTEGEQPGVSVFLRDGESVFHTYSAFARQRPPRLDRDVSRPNAARPAEGLGSSEPRRGDRIFEDTESEEDGRWA